LALADENAELLRHEEPTQAPAPTLDEERAGSLAAKKDGRHVRRIQADLPVPTLCFNDMNLGI
jgi:hypothetical protein